MQVYEKTSLIRCELEALFDFHLQSKNIKLITPSDTKVILEDENFQAKEGDVLKITSIKYFIPTKWEVKIEKLERPNILVDVALKSPFALWEHTHSFKQVGAFCELKDTVKFAMPFGCLGALLDSFMMRELKNMFDFRHIKTREILETKENL
jgi:ligand-binding SRPBCC domain-containing protein